MVKKATFIIEAGFMALAQRLIDLYKSLYIIR